MPPVGPFLGSLVGGAAFAMGASVAVTNAFVAIGSIVGSIALTSATPAVKEPLREMTDRQRRGV